MGNQVNDSLGLFLQQRMNEGNISSTTLVFTFFCDVVTQHGGEIWLGSIIHAFAPLGINARLTRTAVYRLVQDGWLKARKQGRRSYYSLTITGQNHYQRAASRIYACNKPEWDGVWILIFTTLVPEDKREILNRGLLWLGFGRLAAGVYALPRKDLPALDELLTDLELAQYVVQMRAEAINDNSLKELVLCRWKLDELREKYQHFVSMYDRAWDHIKSGKTTNAHSLFLFRILLVHEYRKILLNDPELPAAMLPSDWEAHTAQTLVAEIYRELAEPSLKWVNRELLNSHGNLTGGTGALTTRYQRGCSNIPTQ